METWRFTNFGTTANSGSTADAANPDADPWTNDKEYILGTNPSIPDHGPLLAAARVDSNITLTFLARQATGAGYTGLSRYYDVETTPDPANASSWTGVPGYLNIVGENQIVTVTQPLAGGPRFYRLKVRLP
jgi:hypothetical protein